MPKVKPMFEQPTLGMLMKALNGYGTRRVGLRRRPVTRDVRIPCRQLVISLAEDGNRELTRTELQLIKQAARWYVRQRPELLELFEAFLD